MILTILFSIFAVIGLLLMILDFGARANSPAPSMYNSGMSEIGCGIFVICGLIALACLFTFGVMK